MELNKIKTYKSKGIVLGNYWSGGCGTYSTIKLYSEISKEDLIEQNNNALENESLDSGMGYESLIGALIEITTITIIILEDKEFKNEEKEIIFIGDLTEKQIDYLEEVYYN